MEPWSDVSADLYELIFSREDAHRHAERLHETIQERVPGATTLLDVACGTGWHLERLREWYAVEGIDLSPGMVRLASQRLPGVPIHEADMRSFDLGRTFDAVLCLSSSIAWMRTRQDLNRAVETMARHTGREGVLIIEPWDFPEERYEEGPWATTAHSPDRSVALLETTTLEGDTWLQETHYLIWMKESGIEHRVERQALGAFTKADHVAAFERVGLSVDFDPVGLLGRGLFIGTHRPE